jgi:uncharacterized protein (DUF58 family)
MIPKEILKEVRRIQITTSRQVTDVFAGQYQSVFKGKGMEFDEVREYIPGDDVRSIDWNVTARTGSPYVKKFVEERELTVMLLLDMSGSTFYGTRGQLKKQLAARICSVFALAAIRNNDKVGFIAFTDKVEKFIPARKGLRHVLRVVSEALYLTPQGRATDINIALEYLNRVAKRKTVAFLISDFISPDYRAKLTVANKRHDIVAVTITDPSESAMSDFGLMNLYDPETGRYFTVDSSDPRVRRQYGEQAKTRAAERDMVFRSANVDMIDVRTDVAYAQSLMRFFRTREKRLR